MISVGKLKDSTALFSLVAGTATFITLSLFAAYQKRKNSLEASAIHLIQPSPLKTLLPTLSQTEIAQLPYKPNHFQGARDVETPHGNCRIYEFGPLKGPKVLFVHGISTPCMSLGSLADELVKKGARVMLFDLYGRGFSDNPSPFHFPHSHHLYTSQILCCLASSPVPGWTGTSDAFSIVGYSLGGGIAGAFTDSFPSLVSALVRIAPSGLVREHHVAWESKILYHTQGILPERLTRWMVFRRLDIGGTGVLEEEPELLRESLPHTSDEEPVAQDAIPDQVKTQLAVIDKACQWQLHNHPGFLDAFISSIRYAPITGQHETYARIGLRQAFNSPETSLRGGKVTLILGADDPIVLANEQVSDHKDALGNKDRVRVIVLDGVGHEVPVREPKTVADIIWEAWKEDGVPGVH